MSLMRYWPRTEEIDACIKHEAEGAHDAVLLAVHRPTPISYKLVSSEKIIDSNEQELFEHLITEDVPSGVHVLPITGVSGVGKSHIVRILNARLETINADGKFVIIRIPKSASLRKVIELILEKLPEEQYDQVREDFSKAVNEHLDVKTAVMHFGNALEIALKELESSLRAELRANPSKQNLKIQIHHVRNLPDFFGDSELKEHFRDKVFPRFVSRAISGQLQVDTNDFIEDFVPEDLVLSDSIVKNQLHLAANKVERYYKAILQLKDGEGFQIATNMLNEHLVVDKAIRQLFQLNQTFGGMTLQDVIIEIRRRLLEQGRELVIFVEDFKALTGIQDILLKILIQEGVRDGEQQLATMRSAIAVTDGYLKTEDTILTRAQREWRVESKLSDPKEVLKFTKNLVAAYLNAARWGFAELKRNFEAKKHNGYIGGEWISPYEDPDSDEDATFLKAFGYESNIPLFPFTEMAIENLAQSALTRDNILVFNPRFIIDNILRMLLRQGRAAYENKQFPPPSIKNTNLSADVAQWLTSLGYSSEDHNRYQRILSIWGNDPQSINEVGYIPREVFGAFHLEPPSIEFRNRPVTTDNTPSPQKVVTDPSDFELDDKDLRNSLDSWSKGEAMSQRTANQIRKSIAEALNNQIDWGFERGLKIEIQTSQISIPNAKGEGGIAKNAIKVADNYSDQSGMIRSELSAVTRFYHISSGQRPYADMDDDLVRIGNLTDRLGPEVLEIIRSNKIWKLKVSLNLLQTNSLILGGGLPSDNILRIADFLFSEKESFSKLPQDTTTEFISWYELKEKALKVRPELIQLVTDLCSSFQGSGRTPYAIDIVQIANSIQTENPTQTYRDLDLSEELKSALNLMQEIRVKSQARRVFQLAISIRDKMKAELGKEINKKLIVDELKALADLLGDYGIWPTHAVGFDKKVYKNRCDEFRDLRLIDSLKTLQKADQAESEQINEQTLGRIGNIDFYPLIVASKFVDSSKNLIYEVEKLIDNSQKQNSGVDPKQHAIEIQNLLESLSSNLDSFTDQGESS